MTVYRPDGVASSGSIGEGLSLIEWVRRRHHVGYNAAAGERPPHKETQTYGCCVSTLTRFVRPPLQRPLTSRREKALLLSCTRRGKVRQRTEGMARLSGVYRNRHSSDH